MLHELWKQYRKHAKPFPKQEVRRIMMWRDNNCCQYCGINVAGTNWHADHQTAYSRGGRSHIGNLVVSCSKCNLEKSYYTQQTSFHTPIEKRIWAFILYLPHMRLKDWL